MSDVFGRILGLDPITGLLSLPPWTAAALVTLFAVLCMVAFSRIGREDVVTGTIVRAALVLIGAAVSWIVLEATSRSDVASERRALDARVHELMTRAAMSGSALACLDGLAGDAVEESCEKALFQSPEATAAAVSYVTAQLALLADLAQHARRGGARVPPTLGNLRRVLEADRYGFVARVLAVRDSCTAQACATFALLSDTSRVATNLTERTYDAHVARHSVGWPGGAKGPPVAAAEGGAGPAAAQAAPGKGAGLFFPSAASIPPVNIMDAEPPVPAASETTSSVPTGKQAPTPRPARRPTQSSGQAQSGGSGPARQPVDLSAPARSAPPASAPQ